MNLAVWIPYSYLYLPTWDAIRHWEPVGRFCDKDDRYLNHMSQRWEVGEDFVNIEHDVIVDDEQMLSFLRCPNGWCCFPEYRGGPPTLSLARFRGDFIADNINIWMDLCDDHRTEGGKQSLWTRLDSWLVDHADRAPCLHGPPWARNVRPFGSLH